MEFRLQTSKSDLNAAVFAAVAAAAHERGIAVSDSRLDLVATSPRTADFRLTVAVKAMMMSAEIAVVGKAQIGDDLQARIAAIDLEGGGMIAGIARSALEPQLAKVRGMAYPLANLQIPGLRVADVALTTGEQVMLTVRLAKSATA